MALRYGFKSEAEDLALDTRALVGLSASDRMVPTRLAGYLEIPVITLSDLRALAPEAVVHLLEVDRGCFSAATIFHGYRRLIIANDAHQTGRRANSVAHELAHVLLWHQPGPLVDAEGNRRWTSSDEEEADWLAGCLLVPRPGIFPVVRDCGLDIAAAALHFGVSVELMRWRFNQTGVKVQMVRAGYRRV